MPRVDTARAECRVFTFKDGLLSRMAHDLELRATSLRITIDEATNAIEASFDASSLRVEHAMDNGRPRLDALSADDRAKIEKTIRDDVLQVKRHGSIAFRSSRVAARGSDFEIDGELTLHGATRRVTLVARDVGAAYEAEVALHQPDFGIEPYRAALGALKIKPDVRVRVRIPKRDVGA